MLHHPAQAVSCLFILYFGASGQGPVSLSMSGFEMLFLNTGTILQTHSIFKQETAESLQ
jgi:hypothetical protein